MMATNPEILEIIFLNLGSTSWYLPLHYKKNLILVLLRLFLLITIAALSLVLKTLFVSLSFSSAYSSQKLGINYEFWLAETCIYALLLFLLTKFILTSVKNSILAIAKPTYQQNVYASKEKLPCFVNEEISIDFVNRLEHNHDSIEVNFTQKKLILLGSSLTKEYTMLPEKIFATNEFTYGAHFNPVALRDNSKGPSIYEIYSLILSSTRMSRNIENEGTKYLTYILRAFNAVGSHLPGGGFRISNTGHFFCYTEYFNAISMTYGSGMLEKMISNHLSLNTKKIYDYFYPTDFYPRGLKFLNSMYLNLGESTSKFIKENTEEVFINLIKNIKKGEYEPSIFTYIADRYNDSATSRKIISGPGVSYFPLYYTNILATKLHNCIVELALKTDIRNQLHSEQLEIMGNYGATINITTLDKMEQLDSFIKEVLRLTAPFVYKVHLAAEEFTLSNGVTILKNSLFSYNPHSYNRSMTFYPNDTHTISPRRGLASKKIDKDVVTPDRFLFGLNRGCPALKYSIYHIKLVLAMLLREYSIQTESTNHPGYIHHIFLFTKPINIDFIPRASY